jgi:hypothetical protein
MGPWKNSHLCMLRVSVGVHRIRITDVASAPDWFREYLKDAPKPEKNSAPSVPAVPLNPAGYYQKETTVAVVAPDFRLRCSRADVGWLDCKRPTPMALLHIPLGQITEHNILDLIEAKAAETNVIEYKRDTYGNARQDYSEFLADVSSLANTSGGDLIIGVDAVNGIPDRPTPFTGNADDEILRLENSARSGLQPRVSVSSRAIPTEAGYFLILRVARSYNPPHRIIRENSNRFWARSSAGKYEPNVDELRSLFTLAPRIADRTREFRIGRLTRIAAGDAPVTLMYPDSLVVLHLVPFSAFDRDAELPMAQLQRDYVAFRPIGAQSSMAMQINFDGLLTMSNGDRSAGVERAYVQLFRGGIVEAVDNLYVRASGEPLIPVSDTDRKIVSNSLRFMQDLSEIKVDPPYAVLVSFLTQEPGRFNFAPTGASAYYDFMGANTDRAQYDFKEAIFDTVPADFDACAMLMKSTLDQVAHAGGVPASRSYDKDGAFISRQR